ncbi:MAG: mechanosensitive ion channel domain-containing protein [Pseudomonadota bacterium]
MARHIQLMVLCFALLAAFVLPTSAQVLPADSSQTAVAPSLPNPLTQESVRGLVSQLSDQEVRQLLLERLDAVANSAKVAAENDQSAIEFLSSSIVGIGGSVITAVERFPNLVGGLQTGFTNFLDGRGVSGFLWFVGLFIVAFGIGLIFEYAVRGLTRRWRDQVATAEPDGLFETFRVLGLRAALEIVGLLAFCIAVYLAVTLLLPLAPDQELARRGMLVIVLIKAVAVLGRFTLAPKRPDLRLVALDNNRAKKLYRQFIFIGGWIAIMQFLIGSLVQYGVPMGQLRLGFWLNVILYAYVIHVLYSSRAGLIQIIVGRDGLIKESGQRFAEWWPAISILLTIMNWMLVEIIVGAKRFDLLNGQTNITLALIILAPVLDTALRGFVRHTTPPLIGEGSLAERAHQSTQRSYIRIGRVGLFGCILLLITSLWGINLISFEEGGSQFIQRIISGLMVFLAGYIIWELINLWINRRLAKELTDAGVDLDADEPGGGEGGGTGLSRLATVLPVLHLVLQSVVIVMALLIGLGQFGLDITPLLAGAGIVGLAIGFGAQTLVRDVVSGIFFLIDDAFRVGEYLVIDNTVGTVEKISLRSLQLRHHEGPIHTIPYGEIPKVTNNSRDWVIMKLKFTFPFETDANRIKKLFKKVGAEMLEAEYADDLIQTFKSQGVYDVDDVGIVIRGKFMAKPGAQWIIRKDIYTRVQKVLDEAGIQFARKEVRVQIPGLDTANHLSNDQKKAIGAGATDAVEATT